MLIGKKIRLGRLFKNGKTVIIALDHGRRHGPINGIEKLNATIENLLRAEIDALMITVGMIPRVVDLVAGRVGLVARIDGTGTVKGPDPTDDRLISSVDLAVKMGADAVSIMVYIGCVREVQQLVKLGKVSEECMNYGMPLLVEAIPSTPYLKEPKSPESIAYISRIVAEYGADVVKTFYPGTIEGFKYIVERVPIPVVILGGAKKNVREFLREVYGSIKAGGSGVAVGRNVFQYSEPWKIAQALVEIIHKEKNLEEVYELLGIR